MAIKSEGYSVSINFTSRELTARERIAAKTTTDTVKLDECTNNGEHLFIDVAYYVVLDIHNEKSKDRKDYQNYVIFDKNGTKYITGSPSFWKSFVEIAEEMEAVGEEFSIECFKLDSKNYAGKQFLTCVIV